MINKINNVSFKAVYSHAGITRLLLPSLQAVDDSDNDNEEEDEVEEENNEETTEENSLAGSNENGSPVNSGVLRGALNAITKTINQLPTHITGKKKVKNQSERRKQRSVSPPLQSPVVSYPEYSAGSSGANPMSDSANNNSYHYPPNTTVHHPQSSPPMPAESISPQYPLHSPIDYKSNLLSNPEAHKPAQSTLQWDAEKCPPSTQMDISVKRSPPSQTSSYHSTPEAQVSVQLYWI